jgi:hypothetical protein
MPTSNVANIVTVSRSQFQKSIPAVSWGRTKRRKSYPSDVNDEECSFYVNYLTLMTVESPQRLYPLREIFNALRYLVRMGESGT